MENRIKKHGFPLKKGLFYNYLFYNIALVRFNLNKIDAWQQVSRYFYDTFVLNRDCANLFSHHVKNRNEPGIVITNIKDEFSVIWVRIQLDCNCVNSIVNACCSILANGNGACDGASG